MLGGYEILLIAFLVGMCAGIFVGYWYAERREWTMDDVLDLADRIKDNKHVRNHVIDPAIEEIRKAFGGEDGP